MTPPLTILNYAPKVPIKDLKDDPGNVNTHDSANLDAIQASMVQFGQVEPLVVRKTDMVVFAGNGRLTVLRRMNVRTARVQFIDGTDESCRAYAIAANRTTRLSKFDDVKLGEQLVDLREVDVDLMLAAGFTAKDLDLLLKDTGLDGGNGIGEPKRVPVKIQVTQTCPECKHSWTQ